MEGGDSRYLVPQFKTKKYVRAYCKTHNTLPDSLRITPEVIGSYVYQEEYTEYEKFWRDQPMETWGPLTRLSWSATQKINSFC